MENNTGKPPIHIDPKELSAYVNDAIAEAARQAGLEPGSLVGIGEGMTIIDEDVADYGPCGWCGNGHYIGSINAGFGICNNCGAI